MEDDNFSKLLKQKYLNFNINVIFGDKIQMIFFGYYLQNIIYQSRNASSSKKIKRCFKNCGD